MIKDLGHHVSAKLLWYFIVPRHIKEVQFLRLTRKSDEECKIVGAFDCYGGWINRADMELRSFFNVKQDELDRLKELL